MRLENTVEPIQWNTYYRDTDMTPQENLLDNIYTELGRIHNVLGFMACILILLVCMQLPILLYLINIHFNTKDTK